MSRIKNQVREVAEEDTGQRVALISTDGLWWQPDAPHLNDALDEWERYGKRGSDASG